MDRRRMDANRDRVVHRDTRARKLTVVVALQNLLVATCLLVTFYVYWDACPGKPPLEDNVHIQLVAIADISGNETLQFGDIHSSNMMSLVDKRKDKIYVNCTGPYVLYMDVCYKNLLGETSETTGTLLLQVEGSETPVSTVNLNASREVCRGLHRIAYLRAKDQASLHLISMAEFKIKNVTVGLSYLLGRRCEY